MGVAYHRRPMHVLSLALLLVASQAPGAEAPKPAVPPVPAPALSMPPPPVPPPAAVRTDAPNRFTGPAAAPPAPVRANGTSSGAVPSGAAIEKMGQGDRAFLDRDYRNALFAYMDAAYLAPMSAAPRVKLGRAYLALRYPERAIEQAEKALALDPANAEAMKLLEDARSGSPQAVPPRSPAPSGQNPAAAPPGAGQPSPRVFRFVPEPPAPAPVAAPPAPARVAPTPGVAPAPAQPQIVSAADRYRQGVDLLQGREFEKAVAALSDAIAIDPRLAVAYAARANARFGLGAYREAADDYRKAIELDANLATPLYGLAECDRVLGQPKEAAEMYRRYAESRAPDVRDDLRATAARRAQELR